MGEFKNPYQEPVKKSPGQAEVEAGNYLVMLFRFLGIRMPYKSDVRAVERTGELVKRWWRNLTIRSGN